jgi:DNA cross-link repair 1A protein
MATQFEAAKWIPGTSFLVDGFRQTTTACRHYFLTHAHADHTTGLSRGWHRRVPSAVIYCTPVTARLIVEEQGISRAHVQSVPLDQAFTVEGVQVVPLCANHCPGACMFLFAVKQKDGGMRHTLHTGDFRFHPRMASYPALRKVQLHTLFLDTTYSTPKWKFPDQDDAIASMAKIMKRQRSKQPGAYAVCANDCRRSVVCGKHCCYDLSCLPQRCWRPMQLGN